MVSLKDNFSTFVVAAVIVIVTFDSVTNLIDRYGVATQYHTTESISLDKKIYKPGEPLGVRVVVSRHVNEDCILTTHRFVLTDQGHVVWSQIVPGIAKHDLDHQVIDRQANISILPDGKYIFRSEPKDICPTSVVPTTSNDIQFEIRTAAPDQRK